MPSSVSTVMTDLGKFSSVFSSFINNVLMKLNMSYSRSLILQDLSIQALLLFINEKIFLLLSHMLLWDK